MPRSEEATAFFQAVCSAVQEIPPGRVTSYGHIAKLIGTPQRPRQVGVVLKHLPSDLSQRFNHATVPWQRVINSQGIISPRSAQEQPSGAANQAAALQAEGVTVTTSAMGELCVDLKEYGWFPRVLPSEEADGDGVGESSGSDEDEEDES
ncbi:6-O-methylguanine DNA methyltransferase [Apodospora peruviana]|uniref:6-O-methylguanine DNA methyltransferase n=1 Tax=Apodospora peruviana TaxID=516989 RepID=A0AAE0HZP8_9PEZI|nr:6-O-methylguanine DNA methyltransferase [Apodospora peruviana]